MTAMMAFCPAGSWSKLMMSMTRVRSMGFWGYTSRNSTVSMRSSWFMPIVPIACLPMAHWYVLRGDWLWCGYGMMPVTTPRIVMGSISTCECPGPMSASFSATRQLFSSFTSTYSTALSAGGGRAGKAV